MRMLWLCVFVAVCMQINQSAGQVHEDASMREQIDTSKRLYGIEEHKRITPVAGKLFDGLPAGLKITRVEEEAYRKFTSSGHCVKHKVFTNNSDGFVTDKLCPVVFEVKLADSLNSNSNLSLNVVYFETRNECRDYALHKIVSGSAEIELLVERMKLIKDDNKIGDDLCFVGVRGIIFIRQNTCFHLRCNVKDARRNFLDVARYIDKRFVELNEELNTPKPPKNGSGEKKDGKKE